ncbi:hypothetical protein L249_1374, partial [Ophiocordyceps polyrhachis-furcata BCC 54312]
FNPEHVEPRCTHHITSQAGRQAANALLEKKTYSLSEAIIISGDVNDEHMPDRITFFPA